MTRNVVRIISGPKRALKPHAAGVSQFMQIMQNRGQVQYLRAKLDLAAFIHELNERNVSYALLPWPTDSLHAGADCPPSLLIADEHISRVSGLITQWPAGRPIRLYSTTGLPGFCYRPWFLDQSPASDMAALPPYLADKVLQRAIRREGSIGVPGLEDQFFAFAYHFAYLEGAGSRPSGVPDGDSTASLLPPERIETLARLAKAIGLDLPDPLTLESLDDVLARGGWRPPRDVLERLAAGTPWIARKFFANHSVGTAERPGLTAFFIREQTVRAGQKNGVLDLIEARGFEPFLTVDLTGEQAEKVARSFRGGNWGSGPWPIGGGGPACIVIAHDVMPIPVSTAERRKFPHLDNARIVTAKESIRRWIHEDLKPEQRYNPVHTTDNSRQAWDVLELVAPDRRDHMHDLAEQRCAEFATDFEVVEDLTRNGFRAKVELIRYAGGVAVKKTGRHHALRFLHREMSFLEEFSSLRPEIPPILAKDANYFIVPFINNTFVRQTIFNIKWPRLMPLRETRQLADLLKFLVARGYDPIDLTPRNNVLIDSSAGLKVIDFEFVWKRSGPVIAPERSYCLAGVAPCFTGDVPRGVDYISNPYPSQWYPFTGLDMASFLYDPAWRQAVKRFVNWPTCFISWAVERSLHSERFGLGRAVRRSYGRMRRNAANVRSTLIQSRAKALSAGRATFRHSTRWAEHLDGRYPGLRRLLPLAAKRFLRRLAGPHRQPSARRYIPADLDIAGFFAELRRRQVRYVVLRWFESLPDLDPGEDIDLLVDDEDAVQLLDFLNANAGPVACDVYTVSGLPGTRYKQMPYYPPALAKQIVSRSVSDGLCRMPCAEDHFLSLAYHAVYHKGLRSGLPTTVASLKPVAQPEHDYRSALTELATTLGLEVAIDMESLDQALAEHGWRPPVDTLKQLAIHNEWVRLSFFGQPAPRNALRPQVLEEVSASSGMTLK